MAGNEIMVYLHLQSSTTVSLLSIQWHVAAKSIAMVDASVDDWQRNVQNSVLVVTSAPTIVRGDFIFVVIV